MVYHYWKGERVPSNIDEACPDAPQLLLYAFHINYTKYSFCTNARGRVSAKRERYFSRPSIIQKPYFVSDHVAKKESCLSLLFLHDGRD